MTMNGRAVIISNVVNSANIGMIEGWRGTCLAAEAFGRLWVPRHIFWQELQCDKAVQARIIGFVHDAHAGWAAAVTGVDPHPAA
jgi:hypothetical protein